MMYKSTGWILFWSAFVAIALQHVHATAVNKKVERVIDVSSQLVTITCRIVIENVGTTPLTSYLVNLDDSHLSQLSYISATIGGSGSDKKKHTLQVTKQGDSWKVDLGDQKVAAGATSPTLEVEAVFTSLLTPHPVQILQSERQLVLYNGNHHFLSPYVTKTQSTKVKLPSGGSIESFSKLKPTSQSDNSINYGPYDNVAANSKASKLQVHFENNSPFLSASHLERSIEVSHWAGQISVEEIIDLKHVGATLKGAFSRYEFQREPTNGISAVKSFKTKLPASAQDIYYRDEIGNISTSNVRRNMNNVIAELRPRFPLFGGWKIHYMLGYYLPTQEYLFNDGNQFVLRIPFISHLYDNSVVEQATVRVVLPEGASDIKLRLPFAAHRDKDQVRKTYLDTVGRTVIVLQKSNLVEKHIQDFEVQYTYNRLFMLQEPILLILALFLLCLTVMVCVRLDFSIGTPKKTSDTVSSKEQLSADTSTSSTSKVNRRKIH